VADAAEARAVYAALLPLKDAGRITELVPAARTVLVEGDPLPDLAALLAGVRPGPPVAGPTVAVPVTYDGPDLAEVAELTGLAAAEVARRHAEAEYVVAFCGFAPGFGYLTGLPAELHVPRRDSPRTAVPAGSVAVAGEFTGVYPRRSPGGWRLLGRTAVVLWDAGRDPPALLAPGTRVRFTR
jgi:KipI family sensor histidine kinase inhibitor